MNLTLNEMPVPEFDASFALKEAWDFDPPKVMAFSHCMPNTLRRPLSGGCITRMSKEDYLKRLKRDFEQKKGHYFAYIMNSDGEEADTYTLRAWQIFEPNDGTFEAVVILYYAALDEDATIRKHCKGALLEEYLEERATRDRLQNLIQGDKEQKSSPISD